MFTGTVKLEYLTEEHYNRKREAMAMIYKVLTKDTKFLPGDVKEYIDFGALGEDSEGTHVLTGKYISTVQL